MWYWAKVIFWNFRGFSDTSLTGVNPVREMILTMRTRRAPQIISEIRRVHEIELENGRMCQMKKEIYWKELISLIGSLHSNRVKRWNSNGIIPVKLYQDISDNLERGENYAIEGERFDKLIELQILIRFCHHSRKPKSNSILDCIIKKWELDKWITWSYERKIKTCRERVWREKCQKKCPSRGKSAEEVYSIVLFEGWFSTRGCFFALTGESLEWIADMSIDRGPA